MCVDTVPPIALEDVIALWADAQWFGFELSLAAKTGLLHSDLLKPPTTQFSGPRRRAEPAGACPLQLMVGRLRIRLLPIDDEADSPCFLLGLHLACVAKQLHRGLMG